MTERLYYTDATTRVFDARVSDVAQDGVRVYLERTAFYPTSGGQPHDTGTLAGITVVDVVDEGDRIAHVLERALAGVGAGSTVHGEVDWPRRHDHMQQHTGQHLLSAVLEDLAGLRTVSVHFGAETSTLDVADAAGDAAPLPGDVMERVERRANGIVGEARPVVVSFEGASAATGLRKASDREGVLRIVSIEGLDRSACGGTHVATTAEIGAILLRRQERVRQGLRIEFVCGDRAISRARRDLDALHRIARVYSASIDDVAVLVESQAAQLRDMQAEAKRQAERLAAYRAAELHAATSSGPDGVRRVVERVEGGADTSRSLAMAMSALSATVFIAASTSPPSVLVATSPDSGVDAGKTLRPLLEKVQGRGGGSPRLAQGSAPSAAAVEQVVSWLVSPAGSDRASA